MTDRDTTSDFAVRLEEVSLDYGGRPVLDGLSASFRRRAITTIIGPSGVGKSSLLYVVNRLWEEIPCTRFSGTVRLFLGGKHVDIYDRSIQANELRRKVATVFQHPNPIPMSIFRNVALPLTFAGVKDPEIVGERVRAALERSFLWNEVRDRLNENALGLSGGQQQRLCIARALVLDPEIILFDEPTSSLDHAAAARIEELLLDLRGRASLVVISHHRDQVARISDEVFELRDGRLATESLPGRSVQPR